METELRDTLARIERNSLLAAKSVLNIEDLALLLGCSPKTIRNRLSEIPHYKNGFRTWFRREEIEAWQCQVKCTPITQILNS